MIWINNHISISSTKPIRTGLLIIYWIAFSIIGLTERANASPLKITFQKPPRFQWNVKNCTSWKDLSNGNSIDYCIQSAHASVGIQKTLYVFHGMGKNTQDICERMTRDLNLFQTDRNISHVICLSFGSHWLIHEANKKESFHHFQTYVQKQYQASATLKPVLYGESMGGFNVLKLSGLEKSKFQKVGAACPALFSIRMPARWMRHWIPQALFEGYDYETSLAIIQDSPYFDKVSYPEILLMVNEQDPLGQVNLHFGPFSLGVFAGIHRGARHFYQNLQTQGQKIHFQSIPGHHCAGMPTQKMIEFLNEGLEEYN